MRPAEVDHERYPSGQTESLPSSSVEWNLRQLARTLSASPWSACSAAAALQAAKGFEQTSVRRTRATSRGNAHCSSRHTWPNCTGPAKQHSHPQVRRRDTHKLGEEHCFVYEESQLFGASSRGNTHLASRQLINR